MNLKTTRWETIDYLKTPEARAAYLEAALEENDPAFFQHALGTVARAQGMQGIAGKSQTTRAGLYKALSSEGNPEFATILRVVNALGYRLAIMREKKPIANAKCKVAVAKRATKSATKRGVANP